MVIVVTYSLTFTIENWSGAVPTHPISDKKYMRAVLGFTAIYFVCFG